ncbi:unnamed protein product [Meloidogyne enterolobii]|uniref:Uncharacterized protein n=1 Tax=Meloidogyne enterolobii TaxID=390850 RepID=A0ACB0Z9P7_MELEN
MKIFILYFFVLLTNLWGILFTNACSCARMSVEEKYCNAGWVAHVKSLRRAEVRDKDGASEYEYTVKLLKTFKDSKTCNQNNKIDCVYSKTNSAACGVNLKDGQEYLLFGYEDDGKRKISLCGYYQEWEKVDEKLKKLLKDGDMDKYCK